MAQRIEAGITAARGRQHHHALDLQLVQRSEQVSLLPNVAPELRACADSPGTAIVLTPTLADCVA
jgi:hypothetical protein